MKKKWKIFFKILYYVVTFALGFFLAIVIPEANEEIVRVEYLNNYIETGEYKKAIDLLGGIYNEKELLNKKCFEDPNSKTGLIIFETALIYEYTEKTDINNPESDEITKSLFNESYACILYDVDSSQFKPNFDAEIENNSKIIINKQYELRIVNSDYDRDGKDDSISTLENSNYLFFKLDKEKFGSITSVDIYKSDGSIYYNEEIKLNYDTNFFIEINEFVKKYNSYYLDGYFSEAENKDLEEIFNSVKNKNSSYLLSGQYSESAIKKEAQKDSIIFILIYFIWIYILGDCLVGQRYIFRFIKYIFVKIRNKIQKETKEPEVLGGSFFATLTLEILNPEELNDENIVISYKHTKNDKYDIEVALNKENGFKTKTKVRGGTYQLIKNECNEYKLCDIPEKLEVKGYMVTVKIKIKKGK